MKDGKASRRSRQYSSLATGKNLTKFNWHPCSIFLYSRRDMSSLRCTSLFKFSGKWSQLLGMCLGFTVLPHALARSDPIDIYNLKSSVVSRMTFLPLWGNRFSFGSSIWCRSMKIIFFWWFLICFMLPISNVQQLQWDALCDMANFLYCSQLSPSPIIFFFKFPFPSTYNV